MMIQDIQPNIYHNEFKLHTPNKDSYLTAIKNRSVLVKNVDGNIEFAKAENYTLDADNLKYLFSVDDNDFFLTDSEDTISKIQKENFEFCDMTTIRVCSPKNFRFAATTAIQLGDWYHHNKVCGACGKPLKHSDKERMLFCEDCGNIIYPKISPAVIVAVIDGDKVLLSKYSVGNYKKYALLAGFNEIGEDIEQTVHREVKEETGLNVKNLRYYKSQPWSFSDTLLLGFFCELDGDNKIVLDENELSEAIWVSQENIDNVPDGISLTNEMILRFKELGHKVFENK